MNLSTGADVRIPASLAHDFADLARSFEGLEVAEARALDGRLSRMVENHSEWASFANAVAATWRRSDHAVVRGFRAADPVALLGASIAIGRRFKPYRGMKIVKRFTMSPWTRALSHTLEEGHFHTDLNTAVEPPSVTAIQCVTPDPSAPVAGELRVAQIADVLGELERRGEHRVLGFLRLETVAMVNDTEPGVWRGQIAGVDGVRFHPETLRAAQRRLGEGPADLEDLIATIKSAALAVTTPIQLATGDILLVSNRRALHYRGTCTVRFRTFPRDFESRTIHVLHLMDEAA